MDNNKKKRALREAYDAALKGEEFQRRLLDAKRTVYVTEAKSAVSGFFLALIIGGVMTLQFKSNTQLGLLGTVIGMVFGAGVMYVLFMVCWRMFRGNVFTRMFEDLANQPADQDGVQRTGAECDLRYGNFGVGQRMVITTRNLYDGMRNDYSRAIHWTGNTPEAIGVGNALARCLHGIDNMQRDLDVDFARGEARAATLLGVSLTMQQVIMELMACLPFISKHLFNHE